MKTSHERAYEIIREAIMNGEFGPGYHLREEELTEYCQTSRTPVRQAIRTLEKEGMIVFRENRRSYVPDVNEREAEEAFDLLSYLECYSAGLAAARIKPAEIENLKRLQQKFEELIPTHHIDQRPILDVNAQFHAAIHAASGNELLQEMIQKASGLTTNLYLKYRITGDPEKATTEHWAMIRALEQNDEQFASLQTKLHVESVRRIYRQYWSSQILPSYAVRAGKEH